MRDFEKSGLAKFSNIPGILASLSSLFLPIVLVYLGHLYKDAEVKDGIHEKYVEMALDILKEPSNENNIELRKWAINVLHHYSEIPIHEEAQAHMLKNQVNTTGE